MKKIFVSYEMALKLKELGFDDICLAYYNRDGLRFATPALDHDFIPWYYKNSSCSWFTNIFRPSRKKENCTAPTHQQVMDWLREKHSIDIFAVKTPEGARKLLPVEQQGRYHFYMLNDNWNPTIPSPGYYENDYYVGLNKIIEESLNKI